MSTFRYWRGFRHEWLREVLGFRLPHRISRLHDFLDADGFHFAQSTGVDGNFMRPLGRYGVVESDDVTAHRTKVAFTWRDTITKTGGVPLARSVVEREHRMPLPGRDASAVLLAGVALDTRCCDEHQPSDNPCNSNGFWPVHVDVGVGPATRAGDQLRFKVRAEIDRGWTPTRGGVPWIEEKPLNHRLDFALDVHVLVLTGQLVATRLDTRTEGSARAPAARSTHARIGGREGYESGFVGLTGFGFTFVRPARPPRPFRKAYDHLGRYLTALEFGLGADRYDAGTASAVVDDRQGVWIPRTVVGTDVRTRLGLNLVQLRGPARIERAEVEGSLCIHSSHQAPFFSHWKRTGDAVGPVRSEHLVPLP